MTTSTKVHALMKRCQIGVGGRNALDDAHDIMADCYRTLGAQQAEIERLTADRDAANDGMLSALRLVADLRFALGDNGMRMQPELIEYAAAMRRDAELYCALPPDGIDVVVAELVSQVETEGLAE